MALEQGQQAPEAPEQAGMEGRGVDQASRGGMGSQVEDIPGAEDMTPEQLDVIKRVTLIAQTAISDPQSGKQLIEQASAGDDGIISASIGLLQLVADKMKLDQEMVIPAAVTVLMAIYGFLVEIGRAEQDEKKLSDLIGKLGALVAHQFKLPQDMVVEQMGGAPAQPQQDKSAMGAIGQIMGGE